MGETVVYTVTLDGGRGTRISAPLSTGALELVSRQPTLDATTSINGRVERRIAWVYRAVRPGTGRIRQFRAEVAGETVTASGVTVSISPASAAPARRAPASQAPRASSSRDLFVRAELSRRTAYVGQQVVVDYVLYFEPEISPRQTAPIGTWDAAGAWREEMDVPSTYPRPATIGGEPYEAVTIRRIALFPTRTGTLELAPMQFTVDLVKILRGGASNDPFAPFFSPFRQRSEDREVEAPAVSIDVRPLPAGAPPSFTGAVGGFEVSTQTEDLRVEAGEAVRIQVAIQGDGNVALLEAPELQAPAGVDAYDPREDREAFRGSEPLRGVKTFTYTFVPQGGGTFTVPAAPFSYFDPARGRYVTVQTEPVEVAVSGDALADAPPEQGPDGPAGLKASARWREAPGDASWLWGVLGGGLALPLLAGGLFLGVRAGRERLGGRSAQAAPASARERLADAQRLADGRAFAEVEAVLRDALASNPDAPAGGRQRAEHLLAECQRGQFAPGIGPDLRATIAEVETVLSALDTEPAGA